ncbi:glycosyltransferase [Maribacter sp. PR1]|uniref:Glycosyltransferase n=1 Tax=Maribacter cobaltidurans TaxID=1178778 RepID=A0ABU7IW91_9FLAO|nr:MULTISPECIES: glycosyltransferase [Maribacter]MDC6389769.1 glycosyltransferase [Maribacter sp. PR1]MEE1977159.1 glycosyltransferase [Maribacter cobaltidurans]
MRYLLVYEHLDRGGIETLIVRMGNWLVNNDHEVLLYVEKDGDMSALLDSRVQLVIPKNKYSIIFNPKQVLALVGNPQIDCVYTFGPKSCLIGGILYSKLENRENINFFSGIYHSREFNTGGDINSKGRLYLNYFKNYLKKGTRVFMSKETVEGIESTAQKTFNDPIIWPLAINLPEKSYNGKPKSLKIVSIGRYVPFKSYNLYMFEVVKELIGKGLDVTWEVYGHGGLKDRMLALAAQKEYEGSIKVHGGIAYDKIPEVLKDTFVFHGMGTALLEAGSYGVPCIPAIAYNDKPNSYGYLYDIPYYTCGDHLGYDPGQPIVGLIEKLYHLNENDFNEHRQKTKEYVAEYGMDALMAKFITFTERTDIGIKIKEYPKHLAYLYVLLNSYYNFRKKMAIRSRFKHFKNLFSKQSKGLSNS